MESLWTPWQTPCELLGKKVAATETAQYDVSEISQLDCLSLEVISTVLLFLVFLIDRLFIIKVFFFCCQKLFILQKMNQVQYPVV